jgi:hypothetical protein
MLLKLSCWCVCLCPTGSPCDQAAKFMPAAAPVPVIQLLPSSSPVYIRYGEPAPFNLAACPAGTAQGRCGAVAYLVQGAPAAGAVYGPNNATLMEEEMLIADTTDCSASEVRS